VHQPVSFLWVESFKALSQTKWNITLLAVYCSVLSFYSSRCTFHFFITHFAFPLSSSSFTTWSDRNHIWKMIPSNRASTFLRSISPASLLWTLWSVFLWNHKSLHPLSVLRQEWRKCGNHSLVCWILVEVCTKVSGSWFRTSLW